MSKPKPVFKINGAVRCVGKAGEHLTYTDVLTDDHQIGPERIKSLIASGTLQKIDYVVAGKPVVSIKPPQGKWALDPDGIRAFGLVRLNTMIAERGGSEKFDTVEEARAFLSQDFVEAPK